MVYTFPAGEPARPPVIRPPYRLREYVGGDEQAWCALLNAGGFSGWTVPDLRDDIIAGLLPHGGIFITHDNDLVACAAACHPAGTDRNAVLMYVAVRPEHRRRGLGSAATLAALEVSRRAGFPGMALLTDEFRPPAIKTYLKIGFVPDRDADPTMPARWDLVFASLDAADRTPGPSMPSDR